jgi:hypothetical protein
MASVGALGVKQQTVEALADKGAVAVHADARRLIRRTRAGSALIGQAMQAMHPAATRGLDDQRLGVLIDLVRTCASGWTTPGVRARPRSGAAPTRTACCPAPGGRRWPAAP